MLNHETTTLRILIEKIRETLSCSQKMIASLIGVNEKSISSNLEKRIDEFNTKPTGKKVISLFIIVENLKGLGLSREVILDTIQLPVFEDLDGKMDSVRSALQADKYPTSVLKKISDVAYQEFVRKNQERKSDLQTYVSQLAIAY